MLDTSVKKSVARSGRQSGKNAGKTRQVPMGPAAQQYAALGWACCPGAHPATDGTRACSCDRIGCPSPGAHPASQVWKMQATTDTDRLGQLWKAAPEANIILPTGRVFDVFDVPAEAGRLALDRMERDRVPAGPVAAMGDERYLFFVATRGAPEDEDEWWSCHLDTVPESVEETPGMRWHCRDSYVVAPPSMLPFGRQVTWVHFPEDAALPDPVRVLEILADVCE
jgi:bifunctional DNA primase/polymerase-like protein